MKIKSITDIRFLVVAIILSFFTGTLIEIGNRGATGSFFPISLSFFINILFISLFVFILFSALKLIWERERITSDEQLPKRLQHFFGSTRKSWIIRGLIIFLCWLPYMIMLFPGIIWFDTGQQISAFLGLPVWEHVGIAAGTIWDHHPFFDTYIFGLFALLGIKLGNLQIGLFILVILQNLAICATFAYLFGYLSSKFSVSKKLLATLFFCICLVPVLPILFCSLVKDTIHAVFFLPWMILYTEAVRSRLSAFTKPTFTIFFSALTLFSGLTTKTGAIIVVIATFSLIFTKTTTFRRSIGPLIATCYILTTSVIMPLVLYPILHIAPADTGQYFVLPLQMTGRWAKDHPGEATQEEINIINDFSIVPYSQMSERYSPFIADPVADFRLKNPELSADYLKVWLKQGIRHPKSYIDAFVALESSWFSIDRPYTETGVPTYSVYPHPPYENIDNRMDIPLTTDVNWSLLQDYVSPSTTARSSTVESLYSRFEHIPIVNILSYQSFWTWLIPMGCLLNILSRKRDKAHLFLLTFPYWLSLLSLYPGATAFYMRYMIGLIYIVPMLAVLLSPALERKDHLHFLPPRTHRRRNRSRAEN